MTLELNTIIQGDCMEVMKNIPDKSIDLVLTDPPYGTTACDWDKVVSFNDMWREIKRITKSGQAVITGSQPFTSLLVASNIDNFKHEWIWQKNAGSNFACVKYQPMKEHENILVFCDGVIEYNPIKQKRAISGKARVKHKINPSTKSDCYGDLVMKDSKLFDDLRFPSSIQKFNRERGLHPTQKPVLLWKYLIKTFSNEGQTILDPFAGSGTTAIACHDLKRNFICIEKEPEYHAIATKRYNEAKAQMTLF